MANFKRIHHEVYESSKGGRILVACYCLLARDHDYRTWVEKIANLKTRQRVLAKLDRRSAAA